MIVSINLDQKPNSERWWRERRSKSACEQNNSCKGQTKVRQRSNSRVTQRHKTGDKLEKFLSRNVRQPRTTTKTA